MDVTHRIPSSRAPRDRSGRVAGARGAGRRMRRARRIVLPAVAGMLAAALAACSGGAQPGPTALPLRPTASASFDTAALVEVLQELVDAGAPAAVIEVRDGDEVWSHAVGVESLKSELPASAERTFRIASLTKPMLAAIVLQLVDEGRFGLDDAVGDLVPGLLAEAPGPVTVRQLLAHTSGIPEYVDVLTSSAQEIPRVLATPSTDAELLALVAGQPWRFAPGERFEYSNSNFIALTVLVEAVTERPFATLLRARITEPLGLDRTVLPEGDGLEHPHLHGYWTEGGLRVDVTLQQASLWSGAGGVESTAADVNTFLRALMRGVVVPPELLGEMLALGDGGYGLGVQGRVDTCPAGDAVRLPADDGVGSTSGADPTAGEEEPSGAGASGDPGGAGGTGGTGGTGGSGGSEGAGDSGEADAAPRGDGPAGDGSVGDGARDAEGPVPTSGSVVSDRAGIASVQIGEPGYVYGHLGSGLGYRSIALTSPDGVRQVTIAWTASPTDYRADPRLEIAYRLADAALSVDC